MSMVITLNDVLAPLDLTNISVTNNNTKAEKNKSIDCNNKKESDINTILIKVKPIKGKCKSSSKTEEEENADKIVDVAEKLKKFLDTNSDITIDKILNESLLKFENKQQLSMFFVTYKSFDVIFKELLKVYNFTIPKELVNKTVSIIIPSIIKEFTGNLKKRCKKNINIDNLCLGRKLDNKQCSRKRHNGTNFCKSHLKRLSNGRIDQPSSINTKSKRGRKRKVQFDPRQYDNEYVTLWEDLIDGEKILIDNNNNIYTFNLESPILLGKKDVNSKLDIIKLIEKYKKNESSHSKHEDKNMINSNKQEHEQSLSSSKNKNKIEIENISTEKIKLNCLSKNDYKET
jgi:hypothetical protein